MKKLIILALLFMGCDYAPTEHSHDYTYEHTHDGIVHEHDYSDVNHTHDHTHDGVCIVVLNNGSTPTEDDVITCYPNYSALDCFDPNVAVENNGGIWYEGTCEEVCDTTSKPCTIIE